MTARLGDRIADEQAALRRVATLVARAAAPGEVFAAVTAEVGRVLASTSRSWADTTRMARPRSSESGPARVPSYRSTEWNSAAGT
jgi:hypothetical protein